MRIAVTGSKGQVATSLLERAGAKLRVIAHCPPALDLADRANVLAGLEAAPGRHRQRRRLYRGRQGRGGGGAGLRVNGEGAGHVAEAAARLGVPCSIFRPTTSSTGRSIGPIGGRSDRPDRGLRPLQARRREGARGGLQEQRQGNAVGNPFLAVEDPSYFTVTPSGLSFPGITGPNQTETVTLLDDTYWHGPDNNPDIWEPTPGYGDVYTLKISDVPEPSTWAMMLVGFAGLGFAGYPRTRKRRSIAA